MKTPKYMDAKRAAIRAARDLNRGVGSPDFPLTLYLEVSNVCNYKCAFCGSFSALNPKRFTMLKQEDRGFLDLDATGGNLDQLIERALTVYLFGFGEPTMHPQFPELVRYIGEKETQVEFVTNGLGLTEDLCRLLVDQRVRMINLSFSGSTKSDYENIYLNGDFEKVLKNVRKLSELKKERGSAYPIISINSIAFRHHIEKLPDFVDIMAGVGANIIVVNGLMVFSAFPELYHLAAVFNPERDGPILDEARRRAENHGITLSTDSFQRLIAHSREEEEKVLQNRASGNLPKVENIPNIAVDAIKTYSESIKPEKPVSRERPPKPVIQTMEEAAAQLSIAPVEGSQRLFCYEPFRTAYIKRDGRVVPCCLWPATSSSFGDITKTSGSEIWNGPAFNLTRSSIVAGEYPRGCHFCVKSRAAPEDPQLWQATSFIEWYRDGYDVDLSVEFGSPNLMRATDITSGLAASEIPGWAQVATIAERQYGWDALDSIATGISDGTAEIIGWIDSATPDGVFGWAYCPQYPSVNLPIELVSEEIVVGKAVALTHRDDLVVAGHGNGGYGFRVGFPVDPSRLINLRFRIPGVGFTSQIFPFGAAAEEVEVEEEPTPVQEQKVSRWKSFWGPYRGQA